MLTSKPKIYKIHKKEKIDTDMQRVYDQQKQQSPSNFKIENFP